MKTKFAIAKIENTGYTTVLPETYETIEDAITAMDSIEVEGNYIIVSKRD